MVALGGLQRNHDLRCTMKRNFCVMLERRRFVVTPCQVTEDVHDQASLWINNGFQYQGGGVVHYIEVSYRG
jgi:hypothetical protein